MTDRLARILERAADDVPEPDAPLFACSPDVAYWGHDWACNPVTCLDAAWAAYDEATDCPACGGGPCTF